MSEEKQHLLLIRGVIFGLPDSDRQAVESAAAELRKIIAQHAEHGVLAASLVLAELAAKD